MMGRGGDLARATGLATVALAALGARSQVIETRYRARDLGCASFFESVRSRIRGESGTALVEDKAGRDGFLVVKGTETTQGISVEAWYDSLVVWRVTNTGRESPDVEAVLGGRYRGILTPTGQYREVAVPFVPNDIAEVADLASQMAEFFPVIPPMELLPGRDWSDSAGSKIRRLSDRRDGREMVRRYEWDRTKRIGDTTAVTDSLSVMVDQVVREKGELRWSERFGPLGWTRRLAINARIPARGGVKRAVTSVVEQDIIVNRLFDRAACQPTPPVGGKRLVP